jgi:hypothetical protein
LPTLKEIGGWIHRHAPHSAEALYASSLLCALSAALMVYGYCRFARCHKHLPVNWMVTTAALAAPIPTWVLLILMPLDTDLSRTVTNDPVVVALAGLYGLSAAIRDGRDMAMAARKRMTKQP